MPKANDIRCKFDEAMFKMLVAGKEVIIEQADGSKWHFLLEDMGYAQMIRAIADSLEKSQMNSLKFGEFSGEPY